MQGVDAADIGEDDARVIPPEAFVDHVTGSINLANELSDDQLGQISHQVISDHRIDKESMSDWAEQMKKGLDLAQMVKSEKTFPFAGAANVKYPLVTSAALQFNARAYPAVVPGDRAVKAKVWGDDPQGTKAARGERVSEHMSYQLSGPIEEWEEETDKLLVQLPITGTCVRKWWFDPAKGRPRCRLVEAGKFVVNNKVRTLGDAPRCGEELPLYPTEIQERILSGEFVEFEWTSGEDEDEAQDFIEQHTRLDLDEDGYREPYVVTVHEETQRVVRIVADFQEQNVQYETAQRMVPVLAAVPDPETGQAVPIEQLQPQEVVTGIRSIQRGSYFVAFQFLPNPSGGFHGLGLGFLLGDISETINTIINQMLDSGSYSLLGGGFVGNDITLKGAAQRFRPSEWKTVNFRGDDIRKALVPLDFPEPNAVMFQLLGLLIEAGRELASVKDVVTGEAPRQQQTATTTLALIEQGLAVFSAAYKRIFRALKAEFKLLAAINAGTVTQEGYAKFHDSQVDVLADYDMSDMDVQPVADPRTVTKMQQAAKAQVVMELSDRGLVNPGEALSRIAESLDIEDSEELAPQPDPAQQQMMMLQIQAAQADLTEKAAKIELTLAQVEETRAQTIEALAGAQSEAHRLALEEKKMRMEGLRSLLEDDRQRLATVLGSAGRMARTSGDGNAPRRSGEGDRTAPGGDLVSLLEPQSAGPGGGAANTPSGGAMAR